MVAELCIIHEDDRRSAPFNNVKQKDTLPLYPEQLVTKKPMCNETKFYHGENKNSWVKRNKINAGTQSIRIVLPTFYPRDKLSRADFFDFRQENEKSAAGNGKHLLVIEETSEFEI